MSFLSLYRSNLKNEQERAIRKMREVATLSDRIGQKQRDISRAGSSSRTQSLTRELERLTESRARAEKDYADSQKKIADLSEKILREEQKEQQAAARQNDKRRAEMQRQMELASVQVAHLSQRIADVENALITRVRDSVANDPVPRAFDVFLSHTSLDKELANELYAELQARNLNVWFDGAEMKLGESLTRQIDHGIAKSHVGVILVTEEFIKGRFWTEHEMGALINARRRVIPVLDGVDHRSLAEYSPLLADLLGLSTEFAGLDEIAEQIASVVTRKGEPEMKHPS